MIIYIFLKLKNLIFIFIIFILFCIINCKSKRTYDYSKDPYYLHKQQLMEKEKMMQEDAIKKYKNDPIVIYKYHLKPAFMATGQPGYIARLYLISTTPRPIKKFRIELDCFSVDGKRLNKKILYFNVVHHTRLWRDLKNKSITKGKVWGVSISFPKYDNLSELRNIRVRRVVYSKK